MQSYKLKVKSVIIWQGSLEVNPSVWFFLGQDFAIRLATITVLGFTSRLPYNEFYYLEMNKNGLSDILAGSKFAQNIA